MKTTNLLNEYSESTNGLPIHKLTVNVYGDVPFSSSKREINFSNCSYILEGKTLTIIQGDSDFSLVYYDGPSELSTMEEVCSFPTTNGGGCGWVLCRPFSDLTGEQLTNAEGWEPNKGYISAWGFDWKITNSLVLYYAEDSGIKIRQIKYIEDNYDFRAMLKYAVGSMYKDAKDDIYTTLKLKHAKTN